MNDILFEYNQKTKNMLSENPYVTLEVPKVHDLLDHIDIWLSIMKNLRIIRNNVLFM